MKILKLGINIGFDCNYNCKHCYIRQNPKAYTKDIMSDETIELLLKACNKFVKFNGQPVFSSTYFLGGEPMLRPHKVIGLMKSLRDIIPTMGLRLCTNGSALQDEYLSEFSNMGVEIQLSINELSLEEFDRRLEKIAKHSISQRPLITLTEENLSRLPEIMDIVYKYTKDCMWHQEFVDSSGCMWHQEYGKNDINYIALYRKMLVYTLKRMLDMGTIINPDLMWEHLHMGWNEKTGFDHVCARHAYIIDPDGSISWCLVNKHSDNKIIGNLYDKDFAFDNTMRVQDHPGWKVDESCMVCDAKYVCGMGCPYQKIYVGPNREVMCEARREIVPLLLQLAKNYNAAWAIFPTATIFN